MALATPKVQNPRDSESPAPSMGSWLTPFVIAFFFAWGLATVKISTLIPNHKELFSLNSGEAMLSDFAFFISYFVLSIPAGMILAKVGYLRGVVIGLVVMAGGCLLFAPATQSGVYPAFLGALYVMAAGITMLQVAANPLIAVLGDPKRSHFRLNIAQAVKALGTFMGPLFGVTGVLMSGVTRPDPAKAEPTVLAAYRTAEAHALGAPFLLLAFGLLGFALIFWLFHKNKSAPTLDRNEAGIASLALLRNPRLGFGVLSLFLYVGVEVAIASLIINYQIHSQLLGLSAETAGRLLAYYVGAAMLGRLIGSGLLVLNIPAPRLLSGAAIGAVSLVLFSAVKGGSLAGYSLAAVGLFNSIMYPTIFTLAIEGAGEKTPQASGLLCMAMAGGAIIPAITRVAADTFGQSLALVAPAACYVAIAAYGAFVHRQHKAA